MIFWPKLLQQQQKLTDKVFSKIIYRLIKKFLYKMKRNNNKQTDLNHSMENYITINLKLANKDATGKNTNAKEKSAQKEPDNSKASLIGQLQDLLKILSDVSNAPSSNLDSLNTSNNENSDPTMQKLIDLEKKATQLGYKEIQKLCMLAIGKRILNIQLKKKKQQFQKKQQKKSQIQEFFRQNRIKKFDYDTLVQTKLAQNSLIVRPYSSGKGFVGSGNDYQNYQSALIECDYINVVRQVNKIFFDIFSGKKKDNKTKVFDFLFKILWIPIAIFLILIFSLPFYSFANEQIVLTILMAIIVFLLTFLTISTYMNVPSANNQMEQSIQDTKKYFERLNLQNENRGKQYKWNCPDNFMYLQVKFYHQINYQPKKGNSQKSKL